MLLGAHARNLAQSRALLEASTRHHGEAARALFGAAFAPDDPDVQADLDTLAELEAMPVFSVVVGG